MTAVLYTEINIFSIAVLMTIFVKSFKNDGGKRLIKSLFIYSVLFAAVANVFDFIFKVGEAGYVNLHLYIVLFANFMYFMCFGISAYFIFLYSEIAAKSKMSENKKAMAIMAFPLVILTVLLIYMSFSEKWFYVRRNMKYQRTEMFLVQQIVSYFYVGGSVIRNISRAVEKKNYVRRDDIMAAATLAIPPLICGVAQIACQDIPIITVGVVMSLLIMYINSLQALISTDVLTGIGNRRHLLEQLEERIRGLKRDERLYFLFIDIDSFKEINDIYGHNEGDRVLKTVASALKSISLKRNGFCARYGGDEFAMIQILQANEDISEIRKQIYNLVEEKNRREKLEYSVSVSIGCAEYTKDTDGIQDLILRADNNMYDKKAHKKEKIKI